MDTESQQRTYAVTLAKEIGPDHREAMRVWLGNLLEIRSSEISRSLKFRRALAATFHASLIWPLLRVVALEVKKHAWDNRSKNSRTALGVSAAAFAVFGGQSAGIAALGTAIGVPLWIVFGAGYMFASTLYEELSGQRPAAQPTTVKIMDAIKDIDGVHKI